MSVPELNPIDTVWRHRWLAAAVAAWTLTAAAGAIASLPSLYRATAKVMVQRANAASAQASLTPLEAGAELEARIQTIRHEVLSRKRLEGLVTRFELYPDVRRRESLEAAVARLRSDINVDLKDSGDEASDAAHGETMTFNISYVYTDPQVAADVSNDLATSYADQNQQLRNSQTHDTTKMLRAQLDEVKHRLDAEDKQASAVRRQFAGELPEQTAANLAAIERLGTELRLNSDRQQRVNERREQLLGNSPNDVRSVHGTEIGSDRTSLVDLRDQLAQLRARFTDQHPDVLRVEQEIAKLEGSAGATAAGAPSPGPTPSPRSVELDGELKALRNEEADLKRQVAEYERRLENAPRHEQDIKERSRDSSSTTEVYFSLLKRYEDARLAEFADPGFSGDQFRVLDSALPPAGPSEPNRIRLLGFACILALAAAGAAVMLADWLDTSFHSLDNLRAFTRVPVLATIPLIVTRGDRIRRWSGACLAAIAMAGLLTTTVVGIRHFARDNVQLVRLLARGRM